MIFTKRMTMESTYGGDATDGDGYEFICVHKTTEWSDNQVKGWEYWEWIRDLHRGGKS